MTKSCLGKTGLRVMRERCSTCIFRPGDLMQLRSGRLKDIVESAKKADSYVICHKTLERGVPGAVCRGSFDTLYTTPIQLAQRLGFIEWREPPKEGSE